MTRLGPNSTIMITVIILVASVTTIIIIASASPWFLSDTKPKLNASCPFVDKCRIAFISPTFTSAAYHKSFYKFYFVYASIPHARKNVTTDLNLLSSNVNNQTSRSSSAFSIPNLAKHLRVVFGGSTIKMLTDADADNNNSIFFDNGTNRFDLILLGHQEYVTQREYSNLKHFVAEGGTLILLDGNVFYAEVKYDRNSHAITLVKGHGWAYNGKSAWRSIGERWANETSNWVGSNYLCYSCKVTIPRNAFQYRHHEEQRVTNPNDQIILNYNASIGKKATKILVATYVLNYQKGKVINLGIYSDDLVSDKKFGKFFDSLLSRGMKT